MKSLLFIYFIILIKSSTIPTLEEVMDYFSTNANKFITIKNIKVWALENYWEHELIPSVSKYLFEEIEMNENIAPEGNPNRPGDKHEKKYITVHDTGDFSFNAEQWSQAVYDSKIGSSPYKVSYQYVVGNDGYYHNIPDDETAYHAGDGATSDSLFKEYPTGVYGDKKNPHITISTDGYYVIEEKKTEIIAPTDDDGKILDESYINDLGIYTNIIDGMYYIGSTWFSDTYRKIGNHGGNTNSIGIESCVNRGSDIYLTWQRTAKLVAKLMDENNFGIEQVVQHHYFSGKDCPQTMRTEGYWNHFLDLVKVEYQILQYKKMGFKIEFVPINSNYINKVGRVISQDQYFTTNANYSIKVISPDGNELKRLFSTSIPRKGIYEN